MATLHIQKCNETNMYTYILKNKYIQLKGKFTCTHNLFQEPCIIILDKNMDANTTFAKITVIYTCITNVCISAADFKSKFAILVRMGGGTMQLDTGVILESVIKKHDNDEGKIIKESVKNGNLTLECVRLLRICPNLNEYQLYKILKLEDKMDNLVFATSAYLYAIRTLEREKTTMTFKITIEHCTSDMKLYFVSGYKNSEEMFKLEVGIERYDDIYRRYQVKNTISFNDGNVDIEGNIIKMTNDEHSNFVKAIWNATNPINN